MIATREDFMASDGIKRTFLVDAHICCLSDLCRLPVARKENQ